MREEESLVINKKERKKSNKISKVWVRLFNRYLIYTKKSNEIHQNPF